MQTYLLLTKRMQIYLQLNDIKQNLDAKHYQEFLDFTQTQNERFIQNNTIKVLEDKIIQLKNNEYIKVKDNDLLHFLNEYVIFKIQDPNSSFEPQEISFLENLGIYPSKMKHHYEILDKLNEIQNLGIKIDYPSQFLSKKLKFPTIDASRLNIKPLNNEFLIAYTNKFNEIEYTSKLNPFYINHFTPYENSKNQRAYYDYLFSKINNIKDDETKHTALSIYNDLETLYLISNHKKEQTIYSKHDLYLKPSDLFDNYFHQRFIWNQQKKIYNSLTKNDEDQLFVLNDFVSLLNKNLSDFDEKHFSFPQQKYKEIVIKTINKFKDKKELSKDKHLQQFLKYQLNLDISGLEKDKTETKMLNE